MTVRHMVLVTLEPGVGTDDPRVRAACDAELALTDVPGAVGWCFGPDVARRPVSADFAGVADFESTADLRRFLDDPRHAEVTRLWTGLASFVVADLEL